ncbi:MAG: hypothetical protein US89_C0005G0083 [Candidatus Peregrinibacteria bacterium GW2011_GWF2_38_29]|nr:MAG: hypothetical protein US89_C0005G0083 [Candidatus Peregrinibacteria bacterium GW2011_GWF2_38_29]HBB02670.1 hypothetical protein [Candidatus Peregrinibacteria bacterium]
MANLLEHRDSDYVGESDLASTISPVLETGKVPYVPVERRGKENLLVHEGDHVVDMQDLPDEIFTRVARAIKEQGSPLVSIGSVVERDPENEAQRIKDVVGIVLPCLKAQVDEMFSDEKRNEAVTKLLTKGAAHLKITLPTFAEKDMKSGKGFSFNRTPTGGDQKYANDETFRDNRNQWFATKVMPILAEELKRYFAETVVPKVKGKAYVPANSRMPHEVGIHNDKLFEDDREVLMKALDPQAPLSQLPEVVPYNSELFVNTFWERDVQKWLQHERFHVFHDGSLGSPEYLGKRRFSTHSTVPNNESDNTFYIAWAHDRRDMTLASGCADRVILEK